MDSKVLLSFAPLWNLYRSSGGLKWLKNKMKEAEEEDVEEELEVDDEQEEDEDVYDPSIWANRVKLAIVQSGPQKMKLVTLEFLENSWKIRTYPCRIHNNIPRNALVIATDATPNHVGGYCIDVANKTCEFYSFPTSMLPPCLAVKKHFNSAEFEMNNLAFALLYWEPLILERRRLEVHTDNNAVRPKGIGPEHGEKVRAHLEHLDKCCGVQVLNKGKHHINKKHTPAAFHMLIIPADTLSRRNTEAFKEKVQQSFRKITKFTQVRPSSRVINEVQDRWDKNITEPCNCKMASQPKKKSSVGRCELLPVPRRSKGRRKKATQAKRVNGRPS